MIGDPFRDTSGPALNPLIEVMNLVALVILPAVINLSDNAYACLASPVSPSPSPSEPYVLEAQDCSDG